MLATIKHNDTGDLVKVARYLTGNAERNAASEKFDATFVSFVCSWQGKNGLTADGVIGKKSWSKMAENAPTCSTAKNKTSAATCALQILLGGLGVDGVFGSKTKNAVAAFQSAKGLKADGVCGPKTWAALIGKTDSGTGTSGGSAAGTGAGQTTEGGKVINKCVHYLQWDKKWKNIKYSTHTSSQTIGNSGCGPTSMAQIMATFIDATITPVEMCKLAVDNGFRTYSNGTAWGFYEFVFKKYAGFRKFVKTSSVETLIAALEQGALAVCSMNSNDNNFWTKGGHFITAIGYDDKGYIYANDPNKSSAPRKQKKDKFKSCMKQAFIFWPEAKEDTDHPFEPVGGDQSTGDAPAPARGSAIIDISKWQPTVNYDKFIKATKLIILRAGYRGTGGSIKIDQCFVKHADALKQRGIRFGVYFYSIAKNESMAREEARMFVKYAKEYAPLFWALDVEKNEITHEAIAIFADEMRKQGVKKLGCYVAHNLYTKYGYDGLRRRFDFTWIPRYGKNDGTVEGSKKPDYECDVWQYTSTGTVPGIIGNVDVNLITGTGKSLDWFLGGDG